MDFREAFRVLQDAQHKELNALSEQHKVERKALLERQLAKRQAFVRDNAEAALEAQIKADENSFRFTFARDLE